jgi:hypothetical protein
MKAVHEGSTTAYVYCKDCKVRRKLHFKLRSWYSLLTVCVNEGYQLRQLGVWLAAHLTVSAVHVGSSIKNLVICVCAVREGSSCRQYMFADHVCSTLRQYHCLHVLQMLQGVQQATLQVGQAGIPCCRCMSTRSTSFADQECGLCTPHSICSACRQYGRCAASCTRI